MGRGPFNPQKGSAGKQAGMARAQRHSDPAWWQAAIEAVREAATHKPILTTDDVVFILHAKGAPGTHENRAYGPMMLYCCNQLQLITPTQDWVESRQAVNHRRPQRVWFSLIYRGNHPVRPRRRRILDPRQFDMLMP